MIFLALLAIPALISLGLLIFAHKRIVWQEFVAQVVIQIVVAGISVSVIYHMDTADVELINGQVTSKERVRTFCEHSYPCNCRQVCHGSGKTRSCSTHCSTCHRHSYDIDWRVYSNINRTFYISRLDSQGLREPPRWTSTQLGEPVSDTHTYTNYIKAAPDTIFKHRGLTEKYLKHLPPYPNKIFDYYRVDRVVLLNGATLPDLAEWNKDLSRMNGLLGPSKQVNVVLVFVKGVGSDFYQALSQHWLGGKKNDVIVVMGTSDNHSLDWVGVMSWTDRQILKVKLRDNLLEVGDIDRNTMLPVIESTIREFFVRKEFSDFKYLEAGITPTPTQFIVALLVGLFISIGLGIYFLKNDPFTQDYRRRR